MHYILLASAFLVIITKFFDCHSTVRRIRYPGAERNRWARPLMLRFGIKKVVWVTFGLTILIVGCTAYFTWETNNLWYQIAFILTSLVVSVVHATVAHTNYSGRFNFVTRRLIRWKHYH